MQLSSGDLNCRYLAAPGTQADGASPFGARLGQLGLRLPADCPLERMVAGGWLLPALRVPLPRRALEAWEDYPNLSMYGSERCPADERWALELYARSMSGPFPPGQGEWWTHPLDDFSCPLTAAVRAHSLDLAEPVDLPPSFQHARGGRVVRPWLDFFAYWQAFHVSDLLDAITCVVRLTEAPRALRGEAWAATLDSRVGRVTRKWEARRSAFEWLSKVRTAIGASVLAGRPWDEAVRLVAAREQLTVQRMMGDVRDVLLVLWQEWADDRGRALAKPMALRELLRQEIEYAVEALRCVGGAPVDFLDPHWHDARHHREWASLIDALPREAELARRDFAQHAHLYLGSIAGALPSALPDVAGLDALVRGHWSSNRPLRRLAVALSRLQRELPGERLMDAEHVIRSTERIEQFLLVVLHGERVLSHVHRKRTGRVDYPEVRALAKDTLNHVLGHRGLHGGVGAAAQARAKQLMKDRAQLHELDARAGLQLVGAAEVGTGSELADHLVAAFVNLVIIRNYAAHHDALDAELIFPGDDPDKHPGQVALTSVLLAVVATLEALPAR